MPAPNRKTAPRPQGDGASEIGRRLIAGTIILVAGAMLGNMPFWSGAWVIIGLLPLLALSSRCPYMQSCKRWWIAAAVVVAVLAWSNAYREWTGANLRLNYRVCGAPIMANGKVAYFLLGTEWVNPHSIDIVVRTESALLEVQNKTSIVPVERGIMRIYAAGDEEGRDIAMVTNGLAFKPPIDLPDALNGRVRYTFKFGRDDDSLNQTLVLDGAINVPLSAQGDGNSFRFSPSSESSPGFIGMCDIEKQMYGRRTFSF